MSEHKPEFPEIDTLPKALSYEQEIIIEAYRRQIFRLHEQVDMFRRLIIEACHLDPDLVGEIDSGYFDDLSYEESRTPMWAYTNTLKRLRHKAFKETP